MDMNSNSFWAIFQHLGHETAKGTSITLQAVPVEGRFTLLTKNIRNFAQARITAFYKGDHLWLSSQVF